MRRFVATLGIVVVVGCGGADAPDAGTASPTKAAPAPRGPVYARGEDVLVTVADIEARMGRTGESPRVAARALLEEAVLAAAAERAGFGRDATATRTRRQLLVQRLLVEEVEAKVTAETIPRAAVEERYRKTLERYVHGTRVTVEHFLARVDERAPSEEVEKARGLTESILAAAREAREEGLEVHRGLVPEGAQVRIETLPPFEKDSIFDPAFEAAALRLRSPGDLSPVVRSSFGFHVIRLLEIEPPARRRIGEVEAEIRPRMVPEMRKRRLRELIEELGTRAEVQVDPRPLAALEGRPEPRERPPPAP